MTASIQLSVHFAVRIKLRVDRHVDERNSWGLVFNRLQEGEDIHVDVDWAMCVELPLKKINVEMVISFMLLRIDGPRFLMTETLLSSV